MFSYEFLNPLLLASVIAAAIPVALHLLGRRNLEKYAFPSLMLLQRVQDEQQKRSRLAEILLLIIRSLIVLLLALAVARPVIGPAGAGGGQGIGTHYVVVLDNSVSMQRRPAEGGESLTLLEEAKSSVRNLIGVMQPTDRLSLMTLYGDRPIWHEGSTVPALSEDDRLDGISVSALPAKQQVGGLLNEMQRRFAQGELDAEQQRFFLLSDFHEAGLDRLAINERLENADWTLLQLDADMEAAQVAISSVQLRPKTIVTGTAVTLTGTVTTSDSELASVPCSVLIDGEVVATGDVALRDGRGEMRLQWQPDADAKGLGWCRCGSDGWPLARHAFFGVNTKGPRRTLVVTGGRLLEGYLPLLLDPGRQVSNAPESPFAVTVVNESAFGANDLNRLQPEIVLLEGLESWETLDVAALEDWVSDGGLLVSFPSADADSFGFNQAIFRPGATNGGLFPLQFQGIAEAGDALLPYQLARDVDYQRSDDGAAVAGRRLVRFELDEYLAGQVTDRARTQVVLEGANGASLIALKQFGSGVTVQSTFTADPEKSDFLRWVGALPLLHTMLLNLVDAGQLPASVTLDGDEARLDVLSNATPVTGNVDIAGLSTELLVQSGLGHWQVQTGDGVEVFGVNVPASERQGVTMARSVLQNRFPNAVFQAIGTDDVGQELAEQRVMPWRVLLWAVVVLLIAETLIANPIGPFLREVFATRRQQSAG